MGYSSIWYEASSDNGATWNLMNGGRSIDNGTGKSPSISQNGESSLGYSVIIAFQEGSDIHVKSFFYNGSTYDTGPEDYLPSGESPSSNITPSISWHCSNVYMVVWKKSSGIAYMVGIMNNSCRGHALDSQGIITGTNNYSGSPTISTDLLAAEYFDVA